MAEDIIRREENVDVEGIGSRISDDIGRIIEHSKHAVAVYLNTEVTLTYWRIGHCIANELDAISDEKYGSKIVSTVSRQLTERFGKGYQRANLFRMLRVWNWQRRFICCSWLFPDFPRPLLAKRGSTSPCIPSPQAREKTQVCRTLKPSRVLVSRDDAMSVFIPCDKSWIVNC